MSNLIFASSLLLGTVIPQPGLLSTQQLASIKTSGSEVVHEQVISNGIRDRDSLTVNYSVSSLDSSSDSYDTAGRESFEIFESAFSEFTENGRTKQQIIIRSNIAEHGTFVRGKKIYLAPILIARNEISNDAVRNGDVIAVVPQNAEGTHHIGVYSKLLSLLAEGLSYSGFSTVDKMLEKVPHADLDTSAFPNGRLYNQFIANRRDTNNTVHVTWDIDPSTEQTITTVTFDKVFDLDSGKNPDDRMLISIALNCFNDGQVLSIPLTVKPEPEIPTNPEVPVEPSTPEVTNNRSTAALAAPLAFLPAFFSGSSSNPVSTPQVGSLSADSASITSLIPWGVGGFVASTIGFAFKARKQKQNLDELYDYDNSAE